MTQSQQIQHQKKPKARHRHFSKKFWISLVFLIIELLVTILWILNGQGVIQGPWATDLPIIFTVIGITLALFQWLFPITTTEQITQASSPQAPLNTPVINVLPPSQAPPQQEKGLIGPQISSADTTITHSETVFLFSVKLPKRDEFFGRSYERTTLLSQTKAHGSSSIVGLRRIGKTWLLQYLIQTMKTEQGSRVRIGYLDATAPSCATLESFTIEALKTLGSSESPARGSGLEALERFVKSKNQALILCIDEFEGLSKKADFDLNFFKGMRSIAQTGLTLVTASKNSLPDIVGKPGETSGFFNIFQQLTLAPFTYDETWTFAEKKGLQAGFTKQEQDVLLKYGKIDEQAWSPARLQLVGKILQNDIYLAKTEGTHYYRPNDESYWEYFEKRLDDGYGTIF
jgi:AAA domain